MATTTMLTFSSQLPLKKHTGATLSAYKSSVDLKIGAAFLALYICFLVVIAFFDRQGDPTDGAGLFYGIGKTIFLTADDFDPSEDILHTRCSLPA